MTTKNGRQCQTGVYFTPTGHCLANTANLFPMHRCVYLHRTFQVYTRRRSALGHSRQHELYASDKVAHERLCLWNAREDPEAWLQVSLMVSHVASSYGLVTHNAGDPYKSRSWFGHLLAIKSVTYVRFKVADKTRYGFKAIGGTHPAFLSIFSITCPSSRRGSPSQTQMYVFGKYLWFSAARPVKLSASSGLAPTSPASDQ